MDTRIKKTLIGGITATTAMTLLMMAGPMMGMPKMPIGDMLAGFIGIHVALGWVLHFMIGTVLAAGYIFVWKERGSSNPVVRGLLFSLLPFFMAQLIVMPMMGAGLFSSNTPAPLVMVMGSLMGHFVYGAVLGAVTK